MPCASLESAAGYWLVRTSWCYLFVDLYTCCVGVRRRVVLMLRRRQDRNQKLDRNFLLAAFSHPSQSNSLVPPSQVYNIVLKIILSVDPRIEIVLERSLDFL